MAFPNGMAVTPDNSTLILAESYAKRLTAFEIGAGGSLAKIQLDRGCFACMLGGVDNRTLFMLAAEWRGPDKLTGGQLTGRVLTAPAPTPGAGWPSSSA